GVQGARIEESWYINNEHMWHLRCASTTECSVQGNKIGDPRSTRVFHTLDPHGITANQTSPVNRRLVFPPPSRTQLRAQTPSEHRVTENVLQLRPQLVVNWLRQWDDQLTDGPKMLHAKPVAELLGSVEETRVREVSSGGGAVDRTMAGM